MEEMRKIVKCIYSGELDAEGRPHGRGSLRYKVQPEEGDSYEGAEDLLYEGDFVHGLRQGEGRLMVLGLINNPVSEYEWYAEGDYDSCGRFIQGANPPGSWRRLVPCWYPCFQGTWEHDKTGVAKYGEKLTKRDKLHAERTEWEAIKEIPFELKQDD